MVNVLGQKHFRFTLVHLFFTQSAQFFSLGFVFSPKPGGEFEDSKSRKKERAWTKREKRRMCCFHNRWLNSLPVLPCTKAEFAVETLMIGSPCTSLQTHTHTHTHTHACKTKQYQSSTPCSDCIPSPRQTFRNSHILLHWSEVRRGLRADRQIKTEEEKVISRIKLLMREWVRWSHDLWTVMKHQS